MVVSRRTRRRAEAFAAALEGSAVAAPGLAPMVALAGQLSAVPLRAPAGLSALRASLMTAAAAPGFAVAPATVSPSVAAPATSVPGTGLQLPAWVAGPVMQAATGVLSIAVALTSTGVGAQRSLPGDPLYGLKRSLERLSSRLADDPVDEGSLSLDHATTRVDELLDLLADRSLDVARVEETLRALDSEVRNATELLLSAARLGTSSAASDLVEFADTQTARLMALLPALPPALAQQLKATLSLLARVRRQALPVATKTRPTPTAPAPSGGSHRPSQAPSGRPTSAPSGSPSSVVPTVEPSTGTPSPSLPVILPTPFGGL